ncbi:MAG: hemolysin D [Planctomycetes bacterium]|nr:hemolysin D [Planctomycetota bacterium]
MPAAVPTPSATSRVLRLRRRRDLRAVPLHFGRRRYWAVKDPVSLRYYQLRDEEYRILQMLDGSVSLDDIKDRFEREFAPRRLSLSQLQSFIGMLHHEGLIVADAPGQGDQLLDISRKNRRRRLLGQFSNLLAIRFRGLDPERFLDWLHPKVRWVFSPGAVAACVLLVLAALGMVAVHFDAVMADMPDFEAFFAFRNVVLMLIVVAVTKILHEIGHGIACKHFGGECHEMGLMFLVFTPCLYCNVSDAWMLPNKWHRIAISGAGMYVEIVLASIATLLWLASEPGLLNALCLNVMFVCSVSTVLFNGNPLLRYDGYYMLADLVEVPNLRQQAGAVIRQWLGRFFLGTDLENPRVLPERHRGWLALYAVASTVYRFIVVFAILWFVHGALKPHRLEVLAQMLAVVVVGGMLVAPAVRTVRFLRDPLRTRQVKWSRLLVRGGLVAAFLVALCFIPLPYRVTVPVIIEPQDARRVYVSVGGTLIEAVPAGTVVDEPGVDVVGRLRNLEIDREIAELEGSFNVQEKLVENLRRRALAGDGEASDQLPAAREILDDINKRLVQRKEDRERLTLTAPIRGTVLPPRYTHRQAADGELPEWSGTPLDPENIGGFMKPGTTFCLVGDPRKLEAVLVVDQSEMEFVREDQRVRLHLDETPGEVLWGTIHEIAATDLKVAPEELARHEDLPTRPDQRGVMKPVSTSYQVRVKLDEHHQPLLLRASGYAKIHARPQTAARRLVRYLSRTFRFEL